MDNKPIYNSSELVKYLNSPEGQALMTEAYDDNKRLMYDPVEAAIKTAEWLKSPEGQKSLKKHLRIAEEEILELDLARQPSPDAGTRNYGPGRSRSLEERNRIYGPGKSSIHSKKVYGVTSV